MQRQKTRGSTTTDREDTFFETHILPLLLSKIVADLMASSVHNVAANNNKQQSK